jgi:hypothetical protein
MKDKILNFFKSDSLWKQILGTLIATFLIWIITIIIGLFKGLDYNASIKWTWEILTTKVDLIWILILCIVLVMYIRRNNSKLLKRMEKQSYNRDEVNSKFASKLDKSYFERFEEVYDYRRLKNHPWHEQYVNDDIRSFKYMLWSGNNTKDFYKIENAICGLIAELKEKNWIHNSDKNEIKQELTKCFINEYNHNKEKLEQLLDSIDTKYLFKIKQHYANSLYSTQFL